MTVDWALWRACEKPMPGFGAALEPRFWAAIGELRAVFERPGGQEDTEGIISSDNPRLAARAGRAQA